MATLDGARRAALAVEHTAILPDFPNHPGAPNLRVALWAATLSAQKQLRWNGLQVNQLRPYVSAGRTLPTDPAQVLATLKRGHSFCCLNDATHCEWVDFAWRNGVLAPFEHKPESYADWLDWRKRFLAVAGGHGFSYKTASFAALLMWPTECQLVPVDRHVVARLGYSPDVASRLGSWKLYSQLEQQVVEEWLSAGQPSTIGVWHWYKWSEWRQETGDEEPSDECESHALLSPYAY